MILQGVALVNASALVKSVYKGIDDISFVTMQESIYKGVVANHLVNHFYKVAHVFTRGFLSWGSCTRGLAAGSPHLQGG